MSDLIYRLRYPAFSWTQDGGSQLDKEEAIKDMFEAADEIERLSAAAIMAVPPADRGGPSND